MPPMASSRPLVIGAGAAIGRGFSSGSKSTVKGWSSGADAPAEGRVVESVSATLSQASPLLCEMAARRMSSSLGVTVLAPVARRTSYNGVHEAETT